MALQQLLQLHADYQLSKLGDDFILQLIVTLWDPTVTFLEREMGWPTTGAQEWKQISLAVSWHNRQRMRNPENEASPDMLLPDKAAEGAKLHALTVFAVSRVSEAATVANKPCASVSRTKGGAKQDAHTAANTEWTYNQLCHSMEKNI